jgi:predicted AAA+ superfamily ATPase
METPEPPEFNTLRRIAEALERQSPVPFHSIDLLGSPAYVWDNDRLRPVQELVAQPLVLYVGVDAQRSTLFENSRRLARGLPAHDALLWGSRGMGKSGLVKSVVRQLQQDGERIALIEIERDDIPTISTLLRTLSNVERSFVLFCDDLSFDADESHYRRLRSVLEGGIDARPGNCRFYVTSNRRHLVAREFIEQEAASAINARDVIDDRLALADRFGLSLGFHACDQNTYVAMIAAYTHAYSLTFDAADAIAWATGRGARSGRVAWQYVQELAGRQGKPLGA